MNRVTVTHVLPRCSESEVILYKVLMTYRNPWKATGKASTLHLPQNVFRVRDVFPKAARKFLQP